MAAQPDDDVLWARGLHYAHDGSPALQGVTLGVRTGEIVAVTGPRGSGKSTLLGCLSGRLLPSEGEVHFDGVALHTLPRGARDRLRRERFGYVGSSPELLPELTAAENAALPLLLRGTAPRAARAAAREWLERLDVGDCARRRPGALRQSQRQRVAIARALAHSPAVLFADEPTAPLHGTDRALVLRVLSTAARSHGMTVVLASHEPAVTDPGPDRDPSADPVQEPGTAPDGDTEPGVVVENGDPAGLRLVDRVIPLVDGRRVRPAGTAAQEGQAACSLSA